MFTVSALRSDGNGKNQINIDAVPNQCPECFSRIDAQIVGDATGVQSAEGPRLVRLMFRCPNRSCTNGFIGIYAPVPSQRDPHFHRLTGLLPTKHRRVVRREEISAAAPSYYDMLDDAMGAEQFGFLTVAGPGFRKALEFLVKEYATRELREQLDEAKNSGIAADVERIGSDVEAVNRLDLSQVIKSNVEDPNVKAMAERAIWLGNDQTHYIQRWTEHDLEDLKRLLTLTESYIVLSEQSRKFRETMPEGKRRTGR